MVLFAYAYSGSVRIGKLNHGKATRLSCHRVLEVPMKFRCRNKIKLAWRWERVGHSVMEKEQREK